MWKRETKYCFVTTKNSFVKGKWRKRKWLVFQVLTYLEKNV